MKKEEILAEIETYKLVANDASTPDYLKWAALAEIVKLEEKLAAIEPAPETVAVQQEVIEEKIITTEPAAKATKKHALPTAKARGKKIIKADMKAASKRKMAEKEYEKLAAKYKKVKPDRVQRMYVKNESNNYHTENTVLLAIKYGTPNDIQQAKEMFITGQLEGDASSYYEKQHELNQKLWAKHRQAIAPPPSTDAERDKLMAEIANNKLVLNEPSSPGYLKEAALKEIEAAEAKLAKLDEKTLSFNANPNEPSEEELEKFKEKLDHPAKRKRGWPAGKARGKRTIKAPNLKIEPVMPKGKKLIKTSIKQAGKALKPYTGKKRGRKLGWRKPQGTATGMGYPAILVNSLLVNVVGRKWHSAGLSYAISQAKGKYTPFIIMPAAKINQAYEIYAKLAHEHDVKVTKGASIIKI